MIKTYIYNIYQFVNEHESFKNDLRKAGRSEMGGIAITAGTRYSEIPTLGLKSEIDGKAARDHALNIKGT